MLAVLAIAAPVIAVVGGGAADANTTCAIWGPHDGGLYTRNCDIKSSRIGGLVQGHVYWHYKQSAMRGDWGGGTLQLNDRTADGKCTKVKIKYRGSDPSETVVRKACNGGKYGPFSFDLNLSDNGAFGVHLDGVYSIEHCIGKKASTCIVLWRQKVGQAPPA